MAGKVPRLMSFLGALALSTQAGHAQTANAMAAYQNQAVQLYTNTSSCTNTIWITMPAGTSATTTLPVALNLPLPDVGTDININDGRPHTIRFQDGTIIDVKANGSFEIKDEDAKVIYRANRSRDFNPFINASDKLEDFIKFCGTVGVRQGDMLGIPLKHFIAWLVIEAARADGEPEPSVPLLSDLRMNAQPHCRQCGRFISSSLFSQKLEFCRPVCFEAAFAKNREMAMTRAGVKSCQALDMAEKALELEQ